VQSSSDATSIDSLTINQEMCDTINSSSDSWVDETDVLAAMQNLSLSSSRVVVSSKVFAEVMLKARPPSYDVSKCGNYTVQLAWYRYVLFYLCTVVHSMHC
jgi:hypothetical protein